MTAYAIALWLASAQLVATSPPTARVRPYWPVAVSAVSTTAHTHIQVSGKVTLVKFENDGDLHIRISDGKTFIVAECIPEMPCTMPKIGDTITVLGVSRQDKEHGWYEVHPVETLIPGGSYGGKIPTR